MQNSISTDVVKLDLGVILAHYKEPKFWQKKWTILDTSEIKVVWYITNIDTVNNKINSIVKVTDKNIKRGRKELSDVWYENEGVSLSAIPIDNKEYTQQHFENALYGRTIELLRDVERHIIYEYAEYKKAEQLQRDYKEGLRKIAIAFLDEMKVTDEDMREAYIDSYVDKQYDKDDKVRNLCGNIINNYQLKIMTGSYIYAAAWFNREDDYKKYSDIYYNNHNKKSVGFDIWNKCKEIQTEKWQNSMKEHLNKIM